MKWGKCNKVYFLLKLNGYSEINIKNTETKLNIHHLEMPKRTKIVIRIFLSFSTNFQNIFKFFSVSMVLKYLWTADNNNEIGVLNQVNH